jgi:hypothetical protein
MRAGGKEHVGEVIEAGFTDAAEYMMGACETHDPPPIGQFEY